MICRSRLRDVFTVELERTQNLDEALNAVRVAVLAEDEERRWRTSRPSLSIVSVRGKLVSIAEIEAVLSYVCLRLGVRRESLRKSSRRDRGSNALSRVRWLCAAMLVRSGLPKKRAGLAIDMHHSSVLYGLNQIEQDVSLVRRLDEMWAGWCGRVAADETDATRKAA